MSEIRDIVLVQVISSYRLRLGFDDGTEGEVDVRQLVPFRGVFAPLADPSFFSQVRVDAEAGTIVWPNGADLDPVVLYASATGAALPGSGGSQTAAG